MARSRGANNDIALSLPKLLSANPATDNVEFVIRKLVLGQNGGNLGIMIQKAFEWFDNSNESFVHGVCKRLNITIEQYNKLVEDTTKEITLTYPEVKFIRVYAQKKN